MAKSFSTNAEHAIYRTAIEMKEDTTVTKAMKDFPRNYFDRKSSKKGIQNAATVKKFYTSTKTVKQNK